jgi:hypothetical protein
MQELTNDFHTQNQYLQDLMDNYSTNNTKTVYLSEQMQSLIDINWWLFWIFIFFAIIFSIFLFISPKSQGLLMSILVFISPKTNAWSGLWSIILKIFIIIFIILFPYYIYPIEKYSLILFTYIKDMVIGNPYVAPDF